MEPRISVITLGTADIDRSVDFYTRLGWTPALHTPEIAFFQVGGLVVSIFPGLAEDAGVQGESRKTGLIAVAHNVTAPDQVDAVLAEAEAAGARITQPAHDAVWGGRTGYFADPDGHLWEVAWNPAWPMDAEGRITFKA